MVDNFGKSLRISTVNTNGEMITSFGIKKFTKQSTYAGNRYAYKLSTSQLYALDKILVTVTNTTFNKGVPVSYPLSREKYRYVIKAFVDQY